MKMEDDYVTPKEIERMRKIILRLKKTDRPAAVAETQRLAEMGDFSENVGYQMAKAKLRGINERLLMLEEKLKRAIPIASGPDENGCVRIGSKVTLEENRKKWIYEILGSQETAPERGRISHLSPLGQALLGKRAGESVVLQIRGSKTVYTITAVA